MMRLWSRLSVLLGIRKSPPVQQAIQEPKPPTKTERILASLQKQNYARYLALQCNRPIHLPVPEELDDSSEANLSLSLLHYFAKEYEEASRPVEPGVPRGSLAWVASALLLFGRLEMAEVILDNITRESYQTDHGAGQCNLLPYLAIQTALPIPSMLCYCDRGSGYVKVQATRVWLHIHQQRLQWNEEERCFVFAVDLPHWEAP